MYCICMNAQITREIISTFMVFPVKSINQECRVFEIRRVPVQAVVLAVKIACVVVDYDARS